MDGEQKLQPMETVGQGTDQTATVKIRRRLPEFVNLKSIDFINHGIFLAVIPLFVVALGAEEELWRRIWNGAAGIDVASYIALFVVIASVYFFTLTPSIYLLDFACYKPDDEFKVTKEQFIELARQSGKFDEESLEFKKRILESSGIGDETYVPKSIGSSENTATMKEGRAEASKVIFGALDELFKKTKIRPKEIGILVVNCSLFNPTPSLSAMIINHYKLRGNILSFNLGGMGCSAGLIALDLARDMLLVNPHNYAVVVSTEMVGYNWYQGKDKSMLASNCYFRMGCSAVLLSNRRRDYRFAKYRLEHLVRTHRGAEDRNFRCIYQEEDSQSFKGIKRSKDLVEISRAAIKANIMTLGPLDLPFLEQIPSFSILLWKLLFGNKVDSQIKKPYVPDYKLAFQHFCMQAASKTELDELQRNLELSDKNLEASRAVLHRFGNTSSSSIWYELAYLEAKQRIKSGDRVWQLTFGSGFKCNSAVWKSLRNIRKPCSNPWLECVDRYPHESS